MKIVKAKAVAKVTIEVEVTLLQPFDESETVKRIYAHASRQAIELLKYRINENGTRIVGDPKVSIVTFTDEEAS